MQDDISQQFFTVCLDLGWCGRVHSSSVYNAGWKTLRWLSANLETCQL